VYGFCSIGDMLERQAASIPDVAFLNFMDDGASFTYAQFNARVNEVVYGLMAQGVHHGSFVGLMLGNSIEFLVSSYALKKIGAVEVAINTDFRGPSLSRMINLTESPLLIVGAQYMESLNHVADDLPYLKKLVVVDNGERTQCQLKDVELLDFKAIVTDNDANPGFAVRDDEIAYVLFSSGTTGVSKGLLLSHRYAMSNAFAIAEAYELTGDDIVYTPWPLHHFGSAVAELLTALNSGGGVAIRKRLSISRYWEDTRNCGATWCMMMGASQKYLWDKEPSLDDKNHNLRFTWGGPFPIHRGKFEERFGLKTYYCFGLSDCGMLSVRSPHIEGQPTNCGKVRENYFDVSIVDDFDNELPVGKTGEIVCRPKVPGVILKGYYGMPEYTLEAFRNLWFHTGDLGKFDENGDLHFFERKKHVIKRAGENILPTEVEEVLHQHPGIEESAVLGVRNNAGEEDIVAFVQCVEGSKIDVEELRAFCHDRMARWMVPMDFIVLEKLPRTTTDKPSLGELRKLLENMKAN